MILIVNWSHQTILEPNLKTGRSPNLQRGCNRVKPEPLGIGYGCCYRKVHKKRGLSRFPSLRLCDHFHRFEAIRPSIKQSRFLCFEILRRANLNVDQVDISLTIPVGRRLAPSSFPRKDQQHWNLYLDGSITYLTIRDRHAVSIEDYRNCSAGSRSFSASGSDRQFYQCSVNTRHQWFLYGVHLNCGLRKTLRSHGHATKHGIR